MSRNQRATALSALRSKKQVEKALEQRSATLLQLEDVYEKIETASSQVEVVRAMEGSAGVLAALHRQVGGVEGVESVVERLNEEMGKVEEVSGVIAEAGGDARVVDEGEVDEEFEKMEREEREKREGAERVERERKEKVEREERERREVAEKERRGRQEKADEESLRKLMELEVPSVEVGERQSGEKTPEVEETRKDVETMAI